jgi:lysosomal Pro-X carboxypeptidase
MVKSLVLLSLVCVAFSLRMTTPLQGGDHWIGSDVPGYTNYTFSTFIDHWGTTNDQYSMRYFVNDRFFSNSTGGPIIFYCGNEGAIEMFITATGQIENIAEATSGLIVFGEHRYFGKSLPYGDDSYTDPEKLKYLSPHQALADYAYLITALKQQYNIDGVLALGGSYGGMLAAWFRMKYPYLVDGALAASAPLNHFNGTVNPELFNQIVSNDYKKSSDECYTDIQNGFLKLQSLAGDSANYAKLQ